MFVLDSQSNVEIRLRRSTRTRGNIEVEPKSLTGLRQQVMAILFCQSFGASGSHLRCCCQRFKLPKSHADGADHVLQPQREHPDRAVLPQGQPRSDLRHGLHRALASAVGKTAPPARPLAYSQRPAPWAASAHQALPATWWHTKRKPGSGSLLDSS